jgi:hypothetical protein
MGFLIDYPKLIQLPESRGRQGDLFAQALKQEQEPIVEFLNLLSLIHLLAINV